jgi:menaquinone-9 beta-reductase
LIEKNEYPKHKVCGEYISNEVLGYLQSLNFDPFTLGAKDIKKLTLSTRKSRSISTNLPLGGFSISRFCIDAALKNKAEEYGALVLQANVLDVKFENDIFTVKTSTKEVYNAPLVIGGFGKRSTLDVKMNRAFIKKSSPYLGIKAHYKGNVTNDAVGLHNFKGGYCGVSKVENDHINICYLVDYKTFKGYKSITEFEKNVVYKNKFLKEVLSNSTMVFDKPLTISQVSFSSKKPIENHILMCGDAAGMIHPLAGNGMGMAIRSAQMASNLILDYSCGKLKSRKELELAYTKAWTKEFGIRLKAGHIISRLFRLGLISEFIMLILQLFPFILPGIIKKTHGKPLEVDSLI